MEDKITLRHGDGGKATDSLIKEVFHKHFDNPILTSSLDASLFSVQEGKLAFTTDSFVVKPLFFPGGDIGKLAVCGTVNDLTTAGARPIYLSCGFIIEEGFPKAKLESIVKAMSLSCREAGVYIITGDTKVVEKGAAEGVFINTSGIGIVYKSYSPTAFEEGDAVIITGTIGEHGTAILKERYNLQAEGSIKSDCMALNHLLPCLGEYLQYVRLIKDPTRGGVATALNEIAENKGASLHLYEDFIPISPEVKALNELLGLDPMYLACEGRLLLVVKNEKAKEMLSIIRQCPGCEKAAIIGRVEKPGYSPLVYLETFIGGIRIIDSLDGDMLPRIC